MHCPLCQHTESTVVRTSREDVGIVRVRRCGSCGNVWKTEEIPAEMARQVRRALALVKELQEALVS